MTLHRTLTADDPEPTVPGTVVIDRTGEAWQRGHSGRWWPTYSGDTYDAYEWHHVNQWAPLALAWTPPPDDTDEVQAA